MLCEKSPLRSSAVGMVRYWFPALSNCLVYSCEKKKKLLVLLVLKRWGMKTGPPMLKPAMLYRYRDTGNPVWLLKKLLAFRPSWRCVHQPLPWNCCVPLLVVTLMVAPELRPRSEEHTSELQSRLHLVCRLLLEKKKKTKR